MAGAMHFEQVAASYGSARPPYPEALWRDVMATGLVVPGARVLDLGAGTGQATGEFLARGLDAVAVEPGERLAAELQRRFPGATVIGARAEDIRPAPASFDLVVAATSIHWMDLGVVLPMVHRSLAVRGRLLVWRNVFGDPDCEVTEFRRAVERIVERRGARAERSDDAGTTAAQLAESGLFAIDAIHRYRWTAVLTTEQVLALFGTFSDWSPYEVAEAAHAVSSLGGTVIEHYTSWLIEATPVR